MKLQHWKQDTFTTPNQYHYRKPGDFYSLDGLIPAIDGRTLKRMPSWTGHVDFVANFSRPYGAFYHTDRQQFHFVGTSAATPPNNTLGVMTITHENNVAGGVHSVGSGATAAIARLGGNHKQNLQFTMGEFWFMAWDGHAYTGTIHTSSTPTTVYSAHDAISLLTVRDTIYLIDTLDDIYRWNPTTSAFESFLDSTMELNIRYALHSCENIVMLSRLDDGSLIIYAIDDRPTAELRQIVRLPHESASYLADDPSAEFSTPHAIHNDQLYFSPGLYWSDESDADVAPIWRFDGNSVELVENVDVLCIPYCWGLTTWRGRLLLYFIKNQSQHIYTLHGSRFVQILDAAYTTEDWADLYSLAGELWLPVEDTGTQGWMRLDDYQDGVFTSSWLDFDRPITQKHLVNLSAVISSPIADFNVKLEYRTESGSWTQAANTANARHVLATDLDVDFYLLQIRVTLDDDTGANQDVALHSIGVAYSYGR